MGPVSSGWCRPCPPGPAQGASRTAIHTRKVTDKHRAAYQQAHGGLMNESDGKSRQAVASAPPLTGSRPCIYLHSRQLYIEWKCARMQLSYVRMKMVALYK